MKFESVQFEVLDALLAHLELLHLASHSSGEFCHEGDVAGDLEVGDLNNIVTKKMLVVKIQL